MGKLYKVAILATALNLLQVAYGSEYCSLSVRVLSPQLRRIPNVEVSVLEDAGRVLVKNTGSEDVKFCDLGIKPVLVTIGAEYCNQVVVRNVPQHYEDMYVLVVIYDPNECREPSRVLDPNCRILFRVSDESGAPLKKASIRFGEASLTSRSTDSAGRSFVLLGIGDTVTGDVQADGYLPSGFSVSCSAKERSKEELIILRKK